MAKRIHSSSYFADDKDIRDLLSQDERKITPTKLLAIARQRGLFLSDEDNRTELILSISQLSFSWPQLNSLFRLTNSADRQEKITSFDAETASSYDEVLVAAESLKENRKYEDESYNITAVTSDKVVVEVAYTEVDQGCTRLLQKRERHLKIELEKNAEGTGYLVRHEANERAASIATELVNQLKPPIDSTDLARPEVNTISLMGVKDAHLRTQFFLDVIQNLPGFQVLDVLTLKVDNLQVQDSDEDDEEDDDDAPETEKDQEMKSLVKEVEFKGRALLQSDHYLKIRDAGFFISRIIWKALEEKLDGRCVEFEAEFSDSANCNNFRYNIRSVFDRSKKGGLKITKTPIRDVTISMKSYISALEETARSAAEAAIEAAGE